MQKKIKLTNANIIKIIISTKSKLIDDESVKGIINIINTQKLKENDINYIYNSLLKKHNELKNTQANILMLFLALKASKYDEIYNFFIDDFNKNIKQTSSLYNNLFIDTLMNNLNIKDLEKIHKYNLLKIINSKNIKRILKNKKYNKLIKKYSEQYPKSNIALHYNNYIISKIL